MIMLQTFVPAMALPNSEQVLSRVLTSNGELVLTSHRVVYGWRTRFTSIRLSDVRSVRVARLARRWTTCVIGACVGIVALQMGSTIFRFWPVDIQLQQASALLFLVAFLLVILGINRFNVIQISSPTATIRFRISRLKRDQVQGLLRDLDRVRVSRYSAGKGRIAVQNSPVHVQVAATRNAARTEPAPPAASAPAPNRSAVRPAVGRRTRSSRLFTESLGEWLAEVPGWVAGYTPVAIVAVAIVWTGAKLILSMWHSSFSK